VGRGAGRGVGQGGGRGVGLPRPSPSLPSLVAPLSPSTPWEEGLQEVLQRFAARLDAMAAEMRLDPDERSALLQEVRLRLWKAAPEVETLRGIGPSFVYRAARWAALDLLRDRRSTPGVAAPLEMAADLPAPDRADGPLEAALSGKALDEAVATLARDRGLVVSLWLAGHHRTEIASLLGWGDHRVKNLLYRGLDDLRRALAPAHAPSPGTAPAPGGPALGEATPRKIQP
jgi:RNA polymerase sigma factor (sigma-70 family)